MLKQGRNLGSRGPPFFAHLKDEFIKIIKKEKLGKKREKIDQ